MNRKDVAYKPSQATREYCPRCLFNLNRTIATAPLVA